VLVADVNFKADHVRQKGLDDEFWLWNGAGMMPNKNKYEEFIKMATEQQTVMPARCNVRLLN